MRAIEEKESIYSDLTTVESSARLFKVVVNNYRQKENEISEEQDHQIIDTTTSSRSYGLPPQPAKYLKYPKFDWL